MRITLRLAAVSVAVAAAIDPVFTRTANVRPAVEIIVPADAHPDHMTASTLKTRVVDELADVARFDEIEAPRARLVIGEVDGQLDASVPVYALPLNAEGVVIQQLLVPAHVGEDQQIPIEASIFARSPARGPSEITLHIDGVPVAVRTHDWRDGGDQHRVRFVVPGQRPGVRRVRLSVHTDGETIHADTVVAIAGRSLRVLVYEARPSWTGAFARRLLEDDPRFEMAAVARSTPRVATTSGGASARLTSERLHGYDALILGGLDALSASELDAVLPFVSERGGAVLLLPDRRLSASLLARLGLPSMEELLLEEPAPITSDGLTFKASEFLLPQAPHLVRPLAGMVRAGRSHPAVFASPLGNGTVILSGALDAWRYRGDEEQGLRTFLRSIVADAAGAAPPPVDVSVTPALARPGEPVTVTARIRATEWARQGDAVNLPPLSAALIDSDGGRRMVRLWPTARRGELTGFTAARRAGQHEVSITAGPAVSSAVLVVADDVTRAAGGYERVRRIAALSGGADVQDLTRARAAIESLDETTTTARVRPMRSPWWIVPFAACLGAEWALRRRAGLP